MFFSWGRRQILNKGIYTTRFLDSIKHLSLNLALNKFKELSSFQKEGFILLLLFRACHSYSWSHWVMMGPLCFACLCVCTSGSVIENGRFRIPLSVLFLTILPSWTNILDCDRSQKNLELRSALLLTEFWMIHLIFCKLRGIRLTSLGCHRYNEMEYEEGL